MAGPLVQVHFGARVSRERLADGLGFLDRQIRVGRTEVEDDRAVDAPCIVELAGDA